MEKTNTSRYALGTNYTMPGSKTNFDNFFVDKKNAKAIYTKYIRFSAKRDKEMGLITDAACNEIIRQLNFRK